jgi:nucleotide-binding universal stress UspA family protein
MVVFRKILCAMERGAEQSEAVREAEAIARTHGAEVSFATVAPDERLTGILGRARSFGADLIVVNAPEPGSGASDLAGALGRHAPCAVLVARGSPRSGKILVASDLGDPSFPAVGAAAAEARRRDARLLLVHDVDTRISGFAWNAIAALVEVLSDGLEAHESDARRRMTEALERFGVAGEAVVVHGAPGAAVLRLADSLPAELVVIGSPGESSLRTLLIGSVVESIVHWAPCSVLVVPVRARSEPLRPLRAHAEGPLEGDAGAADRALVEEPADERHTVRDAPRR